MKRLLMVVLTIGAIGCAVDAGPQSSTAPGDDSVDTNASTAELGQVSPSFSSCMRDGGACLLPEACVAGGGTPTVVPCNPFGWVCCNTN